MAISRNTSTLRRKIIRFSISKKYKVYFPLIILLITLLFLFVATLLVFYYKHKPNNLSIKIITISNKPIKALQPNVSSKTSNYNDTLKRFNIFTDLLYQITHKAINFKENNDNLILDSYLLLLIVQMEPEIANIIQLINTELKEIHLLLDCENSPNENVITYTKTLLKYINLINIAFTIFKPETYHRLESLINNTNERSVMIKLTFQHLLLKQQIITTLLILDKFKTLSINLFTNKNADFAIYKVYLIVCDLLRLNYDNMFYLMNKKVTLIYNSETFEIKHIIKDLNVYKKFLITVYYFIYLNLFDINNEFIIEKLDYNINKRFKEMVINSEYKETNEINEEWEEELLLNCRYVFCVISILKVENLDAFYNTFLEHNKYCLFGISKLVKYA